MDANEQQLALSEAFVANGGNGTQAAITAGYTSHSGAATGRWTCWRAFLTILSEIEQVEWGMDLSEFSWHLAAPPEFEVDWRALHCGGKHGEAVFSIAVMGGEPRVAVLGLHGEGARLVRVREPGD